MDDSDSDSSIDFSKNRKGITDKKSSSIDLIDSDNDNDNDNNDNKNNKRESKSTPTAMKRNGKSTPSPRRRNPPRRSRSATPGSDRKPSAASASASSSSSKRKSSKKAQDVLDIQSSSDDDNDDFNGKSISKSRNKNGEEEHDPSIRAASNSTLEKAKAAREALIKAQQYHAEDVVVDLPEARPVVHHRSHAHGRTVNLRAGLREDVVDIDDDDDNEASHLSANPTITYNGPTIRISLRYKGPLCPKEVSTTIKIKMDEPIQSLVDKFCIQHSSWINGSLSVSLNFDGQNVDLTKSPTHYEVEDEDLMDVLIKEGGGGRTGAFTVRGATTAPSVTAAAETVMLHVRRKGESLQHTFQLRKMDPFSKLASAYCSHYGLSSVVLEYNGRVLQQSKSPFTEGIASNVNLDAVAPSGALSSATGGGGRTIKLKFRVNGNDRDVTTLSVPFLGKFETTMNQFAQKKGVLLSACKFIFDGEELRPNTTPEILDLDGDELIDVKVKKSAVPPQRTQEVLQDDDGDVVMLDTGISSRSRPALEEICFQTNRNCNKLPRQKQWKLSNIDPLSKLKDDYIKYYKSKGCKRVQFYFQNNLISDETKFMYELGISNGVTVYAMENGKKYIPV